MESNKKTADTQPANVVSEASDMSNAADRKNESSPKKTETDTHWGWYILVWVIGGVIFGVLSDNAWVGVLWPILLFGVLMVFGAISQCFKR